MSPCESTHCTQQVQGLARTLIRTGSRMAQLVQLMLPTQGFDYKAQVRKSEELQSRAERMGFKGAERLFDVIDAERPVPQRIIQPKTNAKLVLADHYRHKYGIEIYVDPGDPDLENSLDWVRRVLNKNANRAVGFVFFQDRDWRNGIHGEMAHEHINLYSGHCTPMLFKFRDGEVACINLDPVRKAVFQPFQMKDYFIDRLSMNLRMLTAHSIRQADWYSCHTHAMVLLKDGLRHVQDRDDLLSWFGEHDPEAEQQLALFGRATCHLPSPLHKSTQIEKSIAFDECSRLDFIRPEGQKEKPSGGNTLAEHRSKFDITHSKAGWADIFQGSTVRFNHYLNLKAYHQADTVLRRLEGLQNAKARHTYLEALKLRNAAQEVD